jgi:hypothetical protein
MMILRIILLLLSLALSIPVHPIPFSHLDKLHKYPSSSNPGEYRDEVASLESSEDIEVKRKWSETIRRRRRIRKSMLKRKEVGEDSSRTKLVEIEYQRMLEMMKKLNLDDKEIVEDVEIPQFSLGESVLRLGERMHDSMILEDLNRFLAGTEGVGNEFAEDRWLGESLEILGGKMYASSLVLEDQIDLVVSREEVEGSWQVVK